MMLSHLVQLNVARLRAPLDDDQVRGFCDGLVPVNAAGDAAPGFVWRLQTDDGDATAIRMSDDPLDIVNLTVWDSIESLRRFAYEGVHLEYLRQRRNWFTDEGRRTALWRMPIGTVPTIDDATRRLLFVDAHGDSPYAWRSLGSAGLSQLDQLVIAEHSLDAVESMMLIQELDAELVAGSAPDEQNFFSLTGGEVTSGAGRFLVAWLDGRAVGCGAFRMLGDGTAEIKRMYVQPTARGNKIGAAVLHELEWHAAAAGATRLVLETATRLAGAHALYTRAGFTRCPCWGEYADSAHSVCLEKPLPQR